jgi:hypothetical protein
VRQASQAESGKISQALWLTESFPEEIEADLHRYYGVDFLDLFRPGSRLGWRKLLVLIERLPSESTLNTAIRNSRSEDELAAARPDLTEVPWSMQETLMAMLVDDIRMLSWMYASAHSPGQQVPKPSPVPRPGARRRRHRRALTLAAARKLDPRLRGLSDAQAQATLNELTGRKTLCLISSSGQYR